MRRWILIPLLASCVEVAPAHRCTADEDCMQGERRGRCEPTRYCSFADPECGELGFRYHEHTAAPGVCVLPATTPASPAPFALDAAADRIASPCAPAGTREQMFELSSPIAQTLFFDVLGGAAALALHAGRCPPEDAPLACIQGGAVCGAAPYARLSAEVPPGTYCLVVEEADPTARGTLTLRSLPAGRLGRAVTSPGPITGNTCADPRTAATAPSCSGAGSGPETSFQVALCPDRSLQGAVLDPAPFDTVLMVGQHVPTNEVRCANAAGPNAAEAIGQLPLAGPGPYWIVVDSVDPGQCGPFTLNLGF